MIAGSVNLPNASLARERALRALALAAEGEEREAAAEADAAVALAPSTPEVHLARSAVLRQAGRRGEAVRAADEAVRLAPSDPRAHSARAAALAAVGLLADARVAARRASQLAPDDAGVLRRLGDLAIEVDPAEAERHYRAAVRRDPASGAAHAGLARALRRLGRREESEGEYERAAAADPAIGELRLRARALLSAIVQAAAGTFLVVLVLGWVPDVVAGRWPETRGAVDVLAALLAVAGPLALLGWTAVRLRRLGREAPLSPEVREELRELEEALGLEPVRR